MLKLFCPQQNFSPFLQPQRPNTRREGSKDLMYGVSIWDTLYFSYKMDFWITFLDKTKRFLAAVFCFIQFFSYKSFDLISFLS